MNLFFRKAVFGILVLVIPSLSKGSDDKSLLIKADSLYQAKKYTEAFQGYEELFRQNKGSSAMFARMAFIKEGLADYTNALYYLSLYYNQTSDKRVLSKMRELADQHALTGYEYSDGMFISGLIKQYKNYILFGLFLLSLLLGLYIYRKKKNHEQPVTSGIFQLITIACIMVLLNNLIFQDYGIVSQSNSLLMSAPSAGSEPIDIIEKGHKIRLIDAGEVWSKVMWNDREVFIRNQNLKRI
ncbi:MAG: LPXTG cell wall anchor domain-containing protein [Bacteroidota bacterium]